MRILIVIVAAAFVGCQHFKDTVGCYTHTDLRLGYDHSFGDSNFSGSGGDAHGTPKNHDRVQFSGDSFSEDRIEADVTVRFAPGSCN